MGSYDTEAKEIAARLDDQGEAPAADLIRSMADWISTLEKYDLRSPADKAATRDLIVQMAKLHLRAHAHPLPENPAALHWQVTAGLYAALAARMLHHLDRLDTAAATEITEWCASPLDADADADLQQIAAWITKNVAGDEGVLQSWMDEAKTEAEQARDNTTAPAGL
jgi:hypothetical protein